MGNSLEELSKETLKNLPSEEEFVTGEVDANEEDVSILNLMEMGYSYLEVKEKLERDRRAKV